MNSFYTVNDTFESYQRLISFYERNKAAYYSDIPIELRGFFAANMSAALGAILDLLKKQLNNIQFSYVNSSVETILLKNDFLTYFGGRRIEDTYNTTIRYQKLEPKDGRYFKSYVIEELIEGHDVDLPQMSKGVKDKIVEAIYEIFVNAQIHSESTFIYTCGQFYPNKNKIEFTIVDTGVGFRNKINRRFNQRLDAVQAIRWAVQDRKTTKEGVSGGIGLALLREFVSMNRGKMQIVSSEGFYEYGAEREVARPFFGEFPGTIVNLQFNTDDRQNYSLTSEIDLDDIF